MDAPEGSYRILEEYATEMMFKGLKPAQVNRISGTLTYPYRDQMDRHLKREYLAWSCGYLALIQWNHLGSDS